MLTRDSAAVGSRAAVTPGAGWPLTGHQVLREITEALSGPAGGVLVTGGPGAGKTFLATHALRGFREDSLVVTLRCSATLSRIPYGALNTVLSELEPEYLDHPVLVLSGLMRLLRERSGGGAVYLFVDNVDEADEQTSATIAQLARNRAARLVLTCADPLRLPPEISGLAEGGFLTRVDLEPLTFPAALGWLEEALGARVSYRGAQALWAAGEGNPQYVKLLAMEAVDSGSLVKRDGVWVLAQAPHGHGRAVTDLVSARLGPLGEGARRILEALSLAQSLPLAGLLRIAEAEDLDAVQERGLLSVEDSWPYHVRIKSRLVAEVVRENVPPGRSNELRELVMSIVEPDVLTPAMVLPLALWALECGAEFPDGALLTAAQEANARLEAPLALRLLRSIAGHESLPGAVLEEAGALMVLGEMDQALEVLTRARSAARGEPGAGDRVGLLLAESSVRLAIPGARGPVPDLLARARATLDEDPSVAAAGTDPGVRRFREQLMILEAEAAADDGNYQGLAARLTEELETGEPHGAWFALQADGWLCEARALTGQYSDALVLAERLPLQCLGPEIPAAIGELVLSRVRLALLLAGHRDPAPRGASHSRDRRGPVMYRRFRASEVPEGITACLQGHGKEGLDLLVPGICQLRVRDPEGVRALACSAAAYASALEGQRGDAAAYLAEAASASRSRRSRWYPTRMQGYFTALARAELEGPGAGIGQLLGLADEDRDRGNTGYEVLSLSSAVRLGAADVAPRLSQTAETIQGPFGELCARYARGIITGNPEELMAAAALAARLSNDRFALEIAEAVLLPHHTGMDRRLLRRAGHLADICRARLSTAPDEGPAGFALTSRELQIAQMAAAGASNRSIADHLHVSVRTVEGHLYNIYGKLKIADRVELRAALEGAGIDRS